MGDLIRRSHPLEKQNEEGFFDSFLATETAKMGRMLPALAPPTTARCLTLAFWCSDSGEPFLVTVAKDRPGEPYHVKSLEKTYERFLRASGYDLKEATKQALSCDAVDWTGWQCAHCHIGRCTGSPYNFFYCPEHDMASCANRVEAIHGGGLKARCPACDVWRMTRDGAGELDLSGVGFIASKQDPELTPAQPAAHNLTVKFNGNGWR